MEAIKTKYPDLISLTRFYPFYEVIDFEKFISRHFKMENFFLPAENTIEFAAVSPYEVINRAEESVINAAKEKNVVIKKEVGDDLTAIKGVFLQQLLFSFIG